MPDEPAFDSLRTAAFRGLLVKSFKVFPRKLDQILEAERWPTFVEFMAAVGRMGRVLLTFSRPSAKTIQERGAEVAVHEKMPEANTDAMLKLLAAAFVNKPGEEPDTDAVLEAFAPYRIATWHDFAMAVHEIALAMHADRTGGGSPLDSAKPQTLIFYAGALHKTANLTPEYIVGMVDAFGLTTPRHFEALLSAFYSGELTLEDLDRSVGNPALLTEIVNRTPSNPHKGIVFGEPASPFPPGTRPVLGQPVDYLPFQMDGLIHTKDASRFFFFMDLDWPEGQPGAFVAVRPTDWQDPKAAAIEGWRGPDLESEEFGRRRLQNVFCGTVLVGVEGYWNCTDRYR